MGYPVFPSQVQFARPAWHKTTHWNTITQKPAAVRGIVTASLVPYPTWDFIVSLPWTRGDINQSASVLAAFVDIYGQCLGSGVFFYITDPSDYAVSAAQGVLLNVTPGAAEPTSQFGDGVSTQFQLARTIGPSGNFIDIIQNVNGSPTLYVNGSPMYGGYSISQYGVITFNPSVYVPSAEDELTWSGNFYFLCQFSEDTLAGLARVGVIPNVITPEVLDGLWECGDIKFSSIFV